MSSSSAPPVPTGTLGSVASGTKWNPNQYLQFSSDRARPLSDLVARIPPFEFPDSRQPKIADVGCGPGNSSSFLSKIYPTANIVGMDFSKDMLKSAEEFAGPTLGGGNISFRIGDIDTWEPETKGQYDLIFSNAALHWSPNHVERFRDWMDKLDIGGVLAFQVPGNRDLPSHSILREILTKSPKWSSILKDCQESQHSRQPGEYVEALLGLKSCQVDVWETTYIHLLQGEDAILEWVKGTTLTPVFTKLNQEKDGDKLKKDFLEEYGTKLREAYPKGEFGTMYPFRRIFVVARKTK